MKQSTTKTIQKTTTGKFWLIRIQKKSGESKTPHRTKRSLHARKRLMKIRSAFFAAVIDIKYLSVAEVGIGIDKG